MKKIIKIYENESLGVMGEWWGSLKDNKREKIEKKRRKKEKKRKTKKEKKEKQIFSPNWRKIIKIYENESWGVMGE